MYNIQSINTVSIYTVYSVYYRVFVSHKVENCTNRCIESCLFRKRYLFSEKHVMYDLVYGISIQDASIFFLIQCTMVFYEQK